MKRRDARRRPISLLLWGTVLIVAVCGYILSHPFELSPDNPVSHGSIPPGDARASEAPSSDLAVVLWPQSVRHSAESARFDEIDFSWAWVDSLQAEFGPVRVIEVDELDRIRLEDLRVIVVTHSAALFPQLGEQVHRLEHFVNQGGVLVLERPEGSLREAFSADGSGGMRTPRQITSTAEVTEDVANALAQLPLFTRFVGSTGPLEGAETLLAMDGAPVVYRLPRSEGWAVTVDFNYGAALVALQQGRPAEDEFELVAARPALGPTVDDLITDPSLRTAEVPYADLLEHFLIHVVIGRRTPLPGFWPFPEGAAGALVLTHDVTSTLDRADWMVEYEDQRGGSSALFVGYSAVPPATEESASLLAPLRDRVGVLWERGSTAVTGGRRRIGFAGLRPFTRPATLDEVRRHLGEPFGDEADIAGVRTLGGVWDRDYAEPFAEMAAAGFDYDVSYGLAPPVDSRGPAYRHGTGRPFRVHDSNGLPFDLFELPIVAPDLSDEAHLETLEQMVRRSQRSHHQAIGVDVSAALFSHPQALAIFDAWQSLLDMAQRREHLVLSPGELIAYRRQRESVSLRSEMWFARDAGPRAEAPFQLRIEVAGGSDALAPLVLRIPAEADGRRFREARIQEGFIDEGEALETTSVRLYGEEFLLIHLPEAGWTELRLNADYR